MDIVDFKIFKTKRNETECNININETNQKDDVDIIKECECLKRLIISLRYYQLLIGKSKSKQQQDGQRTFIDFIQNVYKENYLNDINSYNTFN